MNGKVGSSLFPAHLKPLEVDAQRSVDAIQKMPEPVRAQILDSIPKTAPEIRGNLSKRLLRRSPDELMKLIGERHLGTTTATTTRVGDLVSGLREDNPTQAAIALAQIADAAGATAQDFAKLRARLQLIAISKGQEGLAQLTPPQRQVLNRVGGQDFQQLVELVQQQLAKLAYQPLLDKVDAPRA
jgi:hypothetical protein